MEYGLEVLTLFFFIGMGAATVDAIAGGGGLIVMPALMSLGVPPAVAVATNKVGAVAGSFSASVHFIRHGQINPWQIRWMIVMTFIGSLLGGMVLTQLNPAILSRLIPFLLIGFALYFIFSPNVGKQDHVARCSRVAFVGLICPLLGFYDGFFGPGTGALMAISCVLLQGFNLVKATAHAKVLNFTSNLAALLFFIFFGKICWSLGLVMLAGQLVGGYLGAHLAARKGQGLIRLVMVTVTIVISIKLLLS